MTSNPDFFGIFPKKHYIRIENVYRMKNPSLATERQIVTPRKIK